MIRASGHVIRHTGRVLHFTMAMAMGLLVASSLFFAGLAYRLSVGPINVNWVSVVHGDAFIIDGAIGLSFEHIALAWEGFHGGVGSPLDLRLSNVVLTDPQGHRLLDAGRALLTLSLRGMLTGHLIPRRLELDDGLVVVTRERGGSFNLGVTAPTAAAADDDRAKPAADVRSVLREFVHPAAIDDGPGEPGQLVRVRLRNFGLTVRDEQLGLTWKAAGSELDLSRRASGDIIGSARVPFVLGDQSAEAAFGVSLPRYADGQIEATLSTIQPEMIGELAKAFPLLATVDAPLSLHAALQLDTSLIPLTGRADLVVGAGRFNLAAGHVPLHDGLVTLSATPERLSIESARFSLPSAKAGTTTDLSLHGFILQDAERLTVSATAAFDRLDLADLAQVWPQGTGGGARQWVIENVSSGTVSHATASVTAESATDLHDLILTRASADLDADNASIAWLDQVPPIEHAKIHLHLVDPDKLVISVPSGRQRISKGGADLLLQDGQMEINGLSGPDQDTKIRLHVDGSVGSSVALLKEPRLHILNKRSVDLKDASGALSATVSLRFPLENSLQAEQIVFQTNAHLSNVRIGKLVAGRDLSGGELDLTADKDGLGVKGQGALAAIPVTMDGSMDFRAGPPSQVIERVTVNAKPDVNQLAAVGADLKDVASGEIPLTAMLSERRNGDATLALNADLAAVALAFQPLAWSKPAGIPSAASATLLLSHDRLTAIPNIKVDSKAFSLDGSAICADGAVRTVSIDRARVGRTDLHGTIGLPANGPIGVVLSGPEIDLSSRLEGDHSVVENAQGEPPAQTRDWNLEGHFDHALLANGEAAKTVSVQVQTADGVMRLLDLTGQLMPGDAFAVRINPAAGGRRLTVDTADAGAFLRASGLTTAVRSGRLSVTGAYDDTSKTHPLAGTARIEGSRIVGAPVMGKVLQAMTLYGVADLLGGPGIGATHILVPFRYDQKQLRISDGRLFSASLGLTAQGLIDLSANRVSINGTIVPAYFFNSMLGYIPFVGKLFSAEAGGGLFAARFSVDGPFSDPTVSVNPLSVLTPGFLRGLFNIGAKPY